MVGTAKAQEVFPKMEDQAFEAVISFPACDLLKENQKECVEQMLRETMLAIAEMKKKCTYMICVKNKQIWKLPSTMRYIDPRNVMLAFQ